MSQITDSSFQPASSLASDSLREIVRRNRNGEPVGTYAVCSAHPEVLAAAVEQAASDGSILHVESTSNQVNQFGGYTGSRPAQFAAQIRQSAARAGLPPQRVLLGADHLGPYCWRSEPASQAMAKARDLAAASVLAGYQKIHLDASMACADDPAQLPADTIAERAAILCQAAEESFASLPAGTPQPVYVIGTEVPVPGGEVGLGDAPIPTSPQDLEDSLSAFRTAFQARGLHSAWQNVIAIVVQPGVEFGESSIFPYSRTIARPLVAALPETTQLVYEAHSTDYQTETSLRELIEDHFAILKVGPWLTFAYREAIFILSLIESEIPQHKRSPSHVRQMLERAMLTSPGYWKPYYPGNEDEQQFARAYSLSDRSRYYWPHRSVQQEVERLIENLSRPLPLALLSQYLPYEYEAVREGRLENAAQPILRFHIRRVLSLYASACGLRAQ